MTNNYANINTITNMPFSTKTQLNTSKIKIRPVSETSCKLMKLPPGKRPPGYRFTDRLHEYSEVIDKTEAAERLAGSGRNGNMKYGLVVFDDGTEDFDELDKLTIMAEASVFLAEAFGFIKPGLEVLIVPEKVYLKALERGCDIGKVHIVADLRENHDLSSDITRDDFVIVSRESKTSIFQEAIADVVYTGSLPDDVAQLAGVHLIQEKVLKAYFDVLGAEERFDIPDGFDILSAMSFKAYELDEEDLDWEGRVAASYAPLISSDVIDWEVVSYDNPIFVRKVECARMVEDLSQIWTSAQENACVGVRIPSPAKDKGKEQVSESALEHSMLKVANMLGIEHSVKAYFKGIPVNDIVG